MVLIALAVLMMWLVSVVVLAIGGGGGDITDEGDGQYLPNYYGAPQCSSLSVRED
jgi:hypothetical protein